MNSFSYEKLAAKLACLSEKTADHTQGVRVIVSCSVSDQGKANTNLKILKQFGAAPLDIYSPQGKFELETFSGLSTFEGLTILIQSIPLMDAFTNRVSSQNNNLYQNTNKFNSHQNQIVRFPIAIPEYLLDMINRESEAVNRFLEQNIEKFTGGYVYIIGFSVPVSNNDSSLMPETMFLPWHLEVDNRLDFKCVVRQSRINQWLSEQAEVAPKIQNLDVFLEEMNKMESKIEI